MGTGIWHLPRLSGVLAIVGRVAAPVDLVYWYAVLGNAPTPDEGSAAGPSTGRGLPSRAVGVLAVIGQVIAGLFYVVFPGLEVTFPTLYLFWAAWVAVLVLTLLWLRGHPWRSAALVVIGIVVVNAVRIFGERQLGWRG